MKLAIFDLDGTLLPVDSGDTWPFFLEKKEPALFSWAGPIESWFMREESEGRFDPLKFALFHAKILTCAPRSRMEALRKEYLERVIYPPISPKAYELVDKAKKDGSYALLITGTISFISYEIGTHFGFDRTIAVEPVVDSAGRFVAKLATPLSFRTHKIRCLELFLSGLGISADTLEGLSFYTDSINDQPLVEYVARHHGIVYAVNADHNLRALAARRHFQTIDFYPKA